MEVKPFLDELIANHRIFTNYYLPEVSLFDENNEPLYPVINTENSLVFQQKMDYDFSRLLVYTTQDIQQIEQNLEKSVLEFIRPKKSNLNDEVLHQWAMKHHLVHYTTFQRMMLLSSDKTPFFDAKITLPLEGDLKKIKQILENQFNVYMERIPSIEELSLLKDSIYIIKEKEEIQALLISEKTGVTEELRYWWVREESRGKKYGSVLMRYFLNKHQETKRFVLWVEKSNISAIEKYQYFGFQEDRIINEIYFTKDYIQ